MQDLLMERFSDILLLQFQAETEFPSSQHSVLHESGERKNNNTVNISFPMLLIFPKRKRKNPTQK
jgi:hypothetical protein